MMRSISFIFFNKKNIWIIKKEPDHLIWLFFAMKSSNIQFQWYIFAKDFNE